ncbi:phosphotransferase enzyme family protein [Annulohypoxylon maeteangense]|uniref:phosphotransferase enzyme family protein n=1 Tax=Annulohypoxylon maeteangense TaxID=1927788 RepID=UPI002007986D|nr:phosphotransferase enzyme family protein [Annulohypoxylon maeteangense]KAI0888050.1 phosphotransferase enzyme family protein [Annulohypoxylon maeteangense]
MKNGTILKLLVLIIFIWAVMRRNAAPKVPIEPERVAAIMLSWQSLEVISLKKLQTLWAGYGYIYELKARATGGNDRKKAESLSLILKFIAPPQTRLDSADEGHLRKLMSYEVEQYFYDSVAPLLGDETSVAHCVATTRDASEKPGAELLGGVTATIMSDLRPLFPVAGEKRSELNEKQIFAALDWLSGFHSTSRKLVPDTFEEFLLPPLEEAKRRNKNALGKLWLNGGYTYLATRRKEYASLAEDEDSEWSSALTKSTTPGGQSISELVADFLTPRGREYETFIHGDVKSENLFTTASGDKVAFYDFQYVGLGLGTCDLAKLFTCSVPLRLLIDDGRDIPNELSMDEGEKKLLEYYYSKLVSDFKDSRGRTQKYDWDVFVRHWETALVDWLRFQASWGFWGNTEWLEARVRSILKDQQWRDWLQENHGSG